MDLSTRFFLGRRSAMGVLFAWVLARVALGAVAEGDLLVTDNGVSAATTAVLKIDASGVRSVLSRNDTGTGTGNAAFSSLAHVMVNPAGEIFVTDNAAGSGRVIQIDPATGNRTVVTGGGVGSGQAFASPGGTIYGLAWDATTSTILVADFGSSAATTAVIRVDPSTGARTLVSRNDTGTGTSFAGLRSVAVDPSGNIYAGDNNTGVLGIFKIDPATGNRTVISGGAGAAGSGTAFVNSTLGISWDGSTGTLLVGDQGSSSANTALYRVDPSTGARTVLASPSIGTGTTLQRIQQAVVSAGTIYIVGDAGANSSVLTLNPSTLVRAAFSGNGAGSGTSASSTWRGLAVYTLMPTVTAISPTSGPAAGGTSVTITGTNFTGATAVTIGGVAATGITVVSATSITAATGAHAAGAVDVAVTTPGGTGTGTGLYTYVAAPTVTAISPTSGPAAGGTSVTITGTNFTGATAVTIGGVAATGITVVSATSITATTGAHAAGAVDVAVTTLGGTGTGTSLYTYVAAPTVTGRSPSAGATSGSTSVTITGTNFTGATAVKFGATDAASFTVTDATHIAATSPAGSAGAVDLRVTTPGGTSATSASDQFTYVAPPTVTSVSPTSGPAAGNSTVTITGTDFTSVTAVKFGANNVLGTVVNSSTSITATSPAGSGTVDIIVTAVGGSNTAGASDQYTYISNTPPTLNANAGLTVAEGATGTIVVAKLDFNDAEQADTAITYTVTTIPTHGALKLSGATLSNAQTFTQDDIDNSRVTYVHDGSETTTDSFAFSVSDGQGGSVTGQTFSFTITPVNDAPVVTAGASVGYTELGSVAILDSGLTVTDVDNANLAGATVTISAGFFTGDTLNFTDQNGVTGSYNGTSGVLTLSGSDTLAHYQTALASVTFSSTSHNPTNYGANTSRTISWVANDGAASSSTATSTVSVTAVNDAPTIGGASAGQAVNDNATISPFTGVTIGDADTGSLGVSVSIDTAAKGAFTTLSGFTNAGGGSYTFSGTAAAATTALRGLVFTPTANRVAVGGTETTTFTISVDDSVASPVTNNTTTVVSTSVNDAPTITGAVAGQAVNDNATVAPFTGVTLGDADAPAQTQTVSVTLDTAAKGAFTTLSGFTNAGGGSYTFSGTAAAAATALRGLVFTPTANRVAVGSTETTTFTISVDDGVASAVTNNTTTVVSTSVNDAPTIAGAVAGQAVNDNATVAPFTGVTLGDADAPAQTQTVSVTLDTAAKGAFTTLSGFTNAGGGSYTFSGTAAAATTALRGLVFTPTANRVAVGGTETTTFTISTNDGVASAVTNSTTTVVATSINDAPTDIALSGTTVSQLGGANAVVGALSDTDADVSDTAAYTLVAGTGSTNNAAFNIAGTSLRATDPSGLTVGDYSVRIRVTDAGNATFEKPFTLTVLPPGAAEIISQIDSAAVVSSVTGAGAAVANPAVSDNGRYIAFVSNATDLVTSQSASGGSATANLFLRDRTGNSTKLISRISGTTAHTAGGCSSPAISADGRYVAFASNATNLISPATPAVFQIYLYDRVADTITLVSHTASSATTALNGAASAVLISRDGSTIAFTSAGTDALSPFTPGTGDALYRYDRAGGSISLASPKAGTTSSGQSAAAVLRALSDDGRWIAYTTAATDAVVGQTSGGGATNTFLFDSQSATAVLVNHGVGTPTTTANGSVTGKAGLSADGRYLAFLSAGTNLVAGQSGSGNQLFLYDRLAGTSTLLSHTSGSPTTGGGAAASFGTTTTALPVISSDGRFVVFFSAATGLISGYSGSGTQIYLYDRLGNSGAGSITLVSHSTAGATTGSADAGGGPINAVISPNGSRIVFSSTSTDLLTGISYSGLSNIFTYTTTTGALTFASGTRLDGTAASSTGQSTSPVVSGDGTLAGFSSAATDLASNDGNGFSDLFDVTLPPVTIAPEITSAATASGAYGTAFSYTITAYNTPTSYAVASGTLPGGVTLNTGTGVISGSPTAAGTFNVTLTATNSGGTSPAASLAITIAKVAVTVTATSGQTKVYGATDPTLAYTITSGGPLVGSDAFTGALVRAAGESVGSTYAINQGTLALGSNYTLSFVPANFAITAKPITVTATSGQSKIYGATDPTLAYTITSGGPLVTGDAFTGALARAAGESVGSTYAINRGTLALSSNYTLSFVPANFAITAKAITVTATSGQSKVYGATDPTLAYTITSGGPLVTGDAFTGALARAAGENVGSYAINRGTLALNSNYTLSFVAANFAIAGKAITVTAAGGQSKVYGTVDPTFTYTLTSGGPLVSGDSLTGTLTRATGENVGGSYAIAQGTLTAGANYTLTFVPANFAIIAKPITVAATAGQTKVYGTADPIFAYALSSGGPLVAGDGFTGALTRATGENVGNSYAIAQGTLTAGANYTLTFVPANFAITKAPLTVTADNQSRPFQAANPTLTYTVAGFVFSDTAATALTGAAALATTAGAASVPGTYPITTAAGTLAAANYSFTFADGVLTVTPTYHSADTDGNWQISLIELLRVIDLYNTRSGTTRTGEYHTQTGTVDGFAPGAGAITLYHSADYNHDGKIDLLELLRVIDLYNTRSGTTRTGAYHAQNGTVDGFAPGP